MTLVDQINKDFIEAYKAKQELSVSVLRLLKSGLKNEEINKKAPLTDEDAIKVLRREVKQRRDSSAEYDKLGQAERAQADRNEIEIIEKYLPKQLDEEAVRKIVQEKVSELNATAMSDMGKVIGAVMASHGSEVDGGLVSKVVRELLQ